MVSEHAMLVLILLLAIAVVLLAVALTLYAGKLEARLKGITERIEAHDMGSSTADPAE